MTYSPNAGGLLQIARVLNPTKYVHPALISNSGWLTHAGSTATPVITLPSYQTGDVLILTIAPGTSTSVQYFGCDSADWHYAGWPLPAVHGSMARTGVTTGVTLNSTHYTYFGSNSGPMQMVKRMPNTTQTTIQINFQTSSQWQYCWTILRPGPQGVLNVPPPTIDVAQNNHTANPSSAPWELSYLPQPSTNSAELIPKTFLVMSMDMSQASPLTTGPSGFGPTAVITPVLASTSIGASSYNIRLELVTLWTPDVGQPAYGAYWSTVAVGTRIIQINDVPATADMTQIPIAGDHYVDVLIYENTTALSQGLIMIANGDLIGLALSPKSDRQQQGLYLRNASGLYVQQTDNGATPPTVTLLGRRIT